MSESAEQLDGKIRSAREKLAEAERGLVEVNRMYRHDPPYWAVRQQTLLLEINQQHGILTELLDKRRRPVAAKLNGIGSTMSSELEQIETRIQTVKTRLADTDRQIEETRQRQHEDPWVWGNKRQALLKVKQEFTAKLASLEFQRRCELPAGDSVAPGEWRPATPGFHGSEH